MLVAKKDVPVKQADSAADDRFTGLLKNKEFALDPTHKDYKKDERPVKRMKP